MLFVVAQFCGVQPLNDKPSALERCFSGVANLLSRGIALVVHMTWAPDSVAPT
jgi:hypothetical protein